jgi:hypothetical protein
MNAEFAYLVSLFCAKLDESSVDITVGSRECSIADRMMMGIEDVTVSPMVTNKYKRR